MTPMNENATGNLEEIGQRDHAVTSEYRIFGPPGTGKTTSLGRQITRAVQKYGTEAVLVTSFSRTAAAELAGRDLPVGEDRIGTLHAHCYRALGAPEIAEANVEEWNRDNPELTITPKKNHNRLDGDVTAEDDDSGVAKDGDYMLQLLSRFRGLVWPRNGWSSVLREFDERWTQYKRENGLLDFTDLIEVALRDVAIAPGNPAVIFADEAQDLNPMQLRLIRKWGERANYFIVAGDDDQTIFSFCGATPEAFLDPDIPDDHKIILKQSYRVPEAVHCVADALIHRVKRRQEKVYRPRPARGMVEVLSDGSHECPEALVDSAIAHIEQGRSVMFLAACSYMLRPLIKVLRKNAVPFWNPYRKTNGAWNPIRIAKRTSMASRVLALLAAHPGSGPGHRPWTHADLAAWAECLQAKGILRRGVKKKFTTYDIHQSVTPEMLNELFEPGALDSLMDAYAGDYRALLGWWRERLCADYFERAAYPVDIARLRGPAALLEQPRVVVGTIHSVKGGQADVVYLFPDLSRAGYLQFRDEGQPHESVLRQFYVGVTRAREALYICPEATGMAVDLIQKAGLERG